MAKSLRYRPLFFPQSSKPFSSPSFSSAASSPPDLSIFDCFPRQETPPLSPNVKDKALHFLNLCKTSSHLLQIHAYLFTTGLFQDPYFSGRLLNLSNNLCDDLYHTFLIFKFIDYPSVFCVNTVIKGYSCRNYHEEALRFYVQMLRDGSFWPNSFTFPPVISSCARLGCFRLGEMCHGQVFKFGVDVVLPVRNSVIHFYTCFGYLDHARKVLDEMPVRDVATWNILISGLVERGEMCGAHKVFDEMADRNVVSWNVMMNGYLKARAPGNVLKLFRQMMVLGVEIDDWTAVSILVACGRSNRLKEGRSVHGFLVKMFTGSSLIKDAVMVDMYSKCGRVDVAQVIFGRMPIKNMVAWNSMVLGHCIHGDPDVGLNLYGKMVDVSRLNNQLAVKSDRDLKIDEGNRIVPDEITFVGVLCACARKGMLAEGRSYFSQMTDVFQVKPNFGHYWCMANLLAGVGLMHEAVDFLRNFRSDEDVSSESSLLGGMLGSYRFLGDETIVEQIAKHLIEQDPQNFYHYNLLVNVYAIAGRLEDVAKTKALMKERGIRKAAGCDLIDLKEIVHEVKLPKDLKLI